ncbi:hypothetical protein FNL37_1794 [Methylovorus glucosotrophus]|uniref:helix-turn-helix domain-containing protein n=1 Tax=Methylovorus glucosotrophus TaxID=266009 RepID=UPI0013312129|nr:helix-turn-helix transcriptional regulator [Methylovorus glucosotrophus]KAF0844350.1 hypothetical protein FNL37_1794 [Methylovorus glucosotrophus]
MNPTKQMFPVLVAQAPKLEMAPDLLVKQCKSGPMALTKTCLHSNYTQDTLAEKIGKAREVLSRAQNGRAALGIDELIKVMEESGSVYLLQYMCMRVGGRFVFVDDEDREIYELEQELLLRKARRAA